MKENNPSLLYGALIGDIYGSAYEFSCKDDEKAESRTSPFKRQDRDYTDDSVRTRAILSALEKKTDAAKERRLFASLYPPKKGGFGTKFSYWLTHRDRGDYKSYGNGAGRRISPVAYFSSSLIDCDSKAYEITSLTHGHKEGIKAGAIIADLTYMALKGYPIDDRKRLALLYYPSCLSFDFDTLHKNYIHTAKAIDSVPQALFCFFNTRSFAQCLHAVCYIGGDSDTIGARSLAIASAYYRQIPEDRISLADSKLPKDFISRLKKAPIVNKENPSPSLPGDTITSLPSYSVL